MRTNTIDRRVRRTQKLLKESLLSLMKEKPFADITVADITDRADVNRATFYLHFSNPAQLLESIGEELLENLQNLFQVHQEELVSDGNIGPILEPVLDFIVSYQDLCRLLFEHEQESRFGTKLLEIIHKNGSAIIVKKLNLKNGEDVTYLVAFIAFGLIGVLRTWISSGFKISKEDVLKNAENMADSVVREYLN